MATWKVNTLDVGGNAREGYWVNDTYAASTVELPDNASDAEILRVLKTDGALAQHVRLNMLTIEGDDSTITIDRARDGRPLLQLVIA